jgi:phosphate transport system substrate-binding protein
MSDEFLYRLRISPPPGFTAQLKLRLDAQAAMQARRRTYRRLSILAGLFCAGTALALVSPSLRNYALQIFDLDRSSETGTAAPVAAPTTSTRTPVVSPFAARRRGYDPTVAGEATASQATPHSAAFNPFARSDRPAAMEASPGPAPATTTQDEVSGGALQSSSSITLAGSRSVAPLTTAIVASYQQRVDPRVRLVTDHPDAEVAFGKFCRNEIDLVHSVRPLNKAERGMCTSYGIEYLELPVAYEVLTVVTGRQSTWAGALAPEELKRLDRGGRWSAIHPQWPNRRYTLYILKGDSPDAYSSDVLVGGWSRRAGVTKPDVRALVGALNSDVDGIAYLPFPDFEAYAKALQPVAVRNSRGEAVLPSRASIEDATYEPLSRLIFLYVNARAADRPDVAAFVEFYLSNGVTAIQEAKFVPLAPTAYNKASQTFRLRKIGTVFSQEPGLGVPVDKLLEREAQRYSL